MKKSTSPSETSGRAARHGFTLIELLVVIAIIAILAAMILPALAHAKMKAQGIQCLNDHRQLAISWKMYSDDSNGNLILASDDASDLGGVPGSGNPLNKYVWNLSHMDYDPNNLANTDINANFTNSVFWPYVGKSAQILKCPSDRSAVLINGVFVPRVRSVAMNFYLGGFAGTTAGASANSGSFTCYMKMTQIDQDQRGGTFGPSKLWVFLDEREDVINWGNYFCDMTGWDPITPNGASYEFNEDMPGYYHNRACAFAFADGHSEMRKWLDGRTTPPILRNQVQTLATVYSPRNPDIGWLQDHSSRPVN